MTNYNVTFSNHSWDAMVKKASGKEFNKRDNAYEFSNGRKFEDTDNTDNGIYDGT